MLSTIWDDINNNAEAIVITDIPYHCGSLSNILYEILDDKEKFRNIIKNNNIVGLYSDIPLIQSHRNIIMNDTHLLDITRELFKSKEIPNISATDYLFINSYYRKILRAKLERDNLDLCKGLIITNDAETDIYIIKTLQLLKITCKFLGITSTTHRESFHMDKLISCTFWSNMSEKFISLFGEDRIEVIEEYISNSTFGDVLANDILRTRVMVLLNVIFNIWSGSTLISEGDTITVVPATYITRMVSKLI